jgi:hypothetical protein
MSVPFFFFSYARRDLDSYLKQFFTDLRTELSQMLANENISFQDLSDMEPGDDWDAKLAQALSASRTLLCVYSPWYFSRPYCGKEFRVFLDRQPGIEYVDGAAKNSEKIIPVLWLRKQDLELMGLPPAVAQYILYSAGEHQRTYEEMGLRGILKRKGRRAAAYQDILQQVLDEIVKRAKNDPLDPLENLPTLQAVPSAFEAPPPAGAAAAAPAGQGGPAVLVPVYLGESEAEIEEWNPFGKERSGSLRNLVRELAGVNRVRSQDCWLGLDGDPCDALTVLRSATERNQIPLLVIDPGHPWKDLQPLLVQVAAEPEWRGGILIPGDGADPRVEQVLAGLDPERVMARTFVGSLMAFELVFASMLTELQRRVLAGGAVQRQVTADGPAQKPVITGPRQEGRA